MRVAYVVLYVNDVHECLKFWVEKVGMIEKNRADAGELIVPKVGFANQDFGFELVPLALMKQNPDGLDLATPSIAFRVDDLATTHTSLNAKGVQTSDIGEHSGMQSFAFSDNENRWFAVIQN